MDGAEASGGAGTGREGFGGVGAGPEGTGGAGTGAEGSAAAWGRPQRNQILESTSRAASARACISAADF